MFEPREYEYQPEPVRFELIDEIATLFTNFEPLPDTTPTIQARINQRKLMQESYESLRKLFNINIFVDTPSPDNRIINTPLNSKEIQLLKSKLNPTQQRILSEWFMPSHSLFKELLTDPRFVSMTQSTELLVDPNQYLARQDIIEAAYPDINTQIQNDQIDPKELLSLLNYFPHGPRSSTMRQLIPKFVNKPEVFMKILQNNPNADLGSETQTLMAKIEETGDKNTSYALFATFLFTQFHISPDVIKTVEPLFLAGGKKTEVFTTLLDYANQLSTAKPLVRTLFEAFASEPQQEKHFLLSLKLIIANSSFLKKIDLSTQTQHSFPELAGVLLSKVISTTSKLEYFKEEVPELNNSAYYQELATYFSPFLKSLITTWQLNNFSDFTTFLLNNSRFHLAATLWGKTPLALTQADITVLYPEYPKNPEATRIYLTPYEAERIKRHDPVKFAKLLQYLPKREQIPTRDVQGGFADPYVYLMILLFEVDEAKGATGLNFGEPPVEQQPPEMQWSEQLVQHNFIEAARFFGHERMFKYAMRTGLTRHDAFHRMSVIIKKIEEINTRLQPPITAENFYANVLQKVADDDTIYKNGCAQVEFNELMVSTNFEIEKVLKEAAKYPNVSQLKELVDRYLSNPAVIFSSWSELKRYSYLSRQLEERQALEQLQAEPESSLRLFVEKIAFDKASKVDINAALKLISDPDGLLDSDASHVPDKVFQTKKTSNLTQIPNLDLTARELVLSAVNGSLDQLKSFSHLEMNTRVPVIGDKPFTSLRELLIYVIGRASLGVKGHGAQIGGVRTYIDSLLEPYGLTLKSYFEGGDFPNNEELKQKVLASAFDSLKQANIKVEFWNIRSKLHDKSDPEAIILGNRTASCDNFPDGKRLSYWFNPGASDFSVSLVRPDNSITTLGQGVTLEHIEIHKQVDEVLKQMEGRNSTLFSDLIPPNLLSESQHIPALDNFQVSPNYNEEKYQQVYDFIIEKFFYEYTQRFAQNQSLKSNTLRVGINFTGALTRAPRIPNTSAPTVPLMYSDNTHSDVIEVSLQPQDVFPGEITIETKQAAAQSEYFQPTTRFVKPLTHQDVMKVAYLEGKIYQGVDTLMQYVDNLSSSIVASQINNLTKDRPNLSFKYEDENNRVRGYMISYEGRFSYNHESLGKDEPVIYIMDLASEISEDGTRDGQIGLNLIRGFAEAYANAYGSQTGREPLPIFAEMRSTTSYRLVQPDVEGSKSGMPKKGLLTRQLEKITGVPFEVIVIDEHHIEGTDEKQYSVLIRPNVTKPVN